MDEKYPKLSGDKNLVNKIDEPNPMNSRRKLEEKRTTKLFMKVSFLKSTFKFKT